MNKIYIQNNLITYESELNGRHRAGYWTTHKDQSWVLDLEKVISIAGINCMDGDNDSYFLGFIDIDLKKYFLNVTWEIDGFEILKPLIEEKFKIELTQWRIDFYDDVKILYPESLKNERLYKNSLWKSIRKLMLFDHVADGKLNDNIFKKTSANNAHN
ncbi:hypothetical protein BTO06_04180 [Tenacibaculum sp. SZ-18]|uniref:hypothetical protein n=1 Tax=Tenacibaculum sp. SZ-18 TaxID=754423 RepID=UPI000C2CE652|nr:hypothetical protein [Tenacibaculum sp. SZ-18]AUC14391.1 hypothetical protein BTO06_04180 [Tenacibaculum sp. SZ-18]